MLPARTHHLTLSHALAKETPRKTFCWLIASRRSEESQTEPEKVAVHAAVSHTPFSSGPDSAPWSGGPSTVPGSMQHLQPWLTEVQVLAPPGSSHASWERYLTPWSLPFPICQWGWHTLHGSLWELNELKQVKAARKKCSWFCFLQVFMKDVLHLTQKWGSWSYWSMGVTFLCYFIARGEIILCKDCCLGGVWRPDTVLYKNRNNNPNKQQQTIIPSQRRKQQE